MNTKEFKDTIIEYMKSAIPIIIVDSVEVERATGEIIQIVEEFNARILKKLNSELFNVYIWNMNGWHNYSERTTAYEANSCSSIDTALQFPSKCPKDVSAVYIYQNLQFAWEDRLTLPFVIQGFRDIFELCKKQYKHVFCVGAINNDIPVELSPYIKVVSLNLPNREEIEGIIKTHLKSIESNVTVSRDIIESSLGMNQNDIINSINVSLTRNKGKKIDKATIFECKMEALRRTKLLEYIPVTETINSLGGLDNLKSWIAITSKAFLQRDKAEKYRLPVPKGCLVAGVSGTGKTLGAKVLASCFGLPLLRCDVGRVFGKMVGETEKNTRELFRQIDAFAPAVILFDEVEKIMAGLGSSDRSDSGVTARFIGNILYYMQEKNSPSFFYFTANNITQLPPELMRKGRIDELWFFDLPSEMERKEIFKIHIEKVGRNPDNFDIDKLAKLSHNFSGAEVESVIKSAMYTAFFEDREFTDNDIKNAIETTPSLAKTKEVEISFLREWAKGRARIANSNTSKEKIRRHWQEEEGEE